MNIIQIPSAIWTNFSSFVFLFYFDEQMFYLQFDEKRRFFHSPMKQKRVREHD